MAAPMSLMAVTTVPAWFAAQFTTSSRAFITGLTASAMTLNAFPVDVPKSLASFPWVASSTNFAMILAMATTTSRTRPTTMLRTSIHAWKAPVAAKDWTNRAMALTASPMMARRLAMPSMAMLIAFATAHENLSNTSDGMRFFQSMERNVLTSTSSTVLMFAIAPVWTIFPHISAKESLTNTVTSAAASPIFPNCELNALMAPLMFETPTASMTFCTALAIRLCMFSMAVPMPCVASLFPT